MRRANLQKSSRPPEPSAGTTPEVTGSAIAFAFDDKDGKYESRQVIAPQVNTCQGFNFIRGKLYAVGNGPFVA